MARFQSYEHVRLLPSVVARFSLPRFHSKPQNRHDIIRLTLSLALRSTSTCLLETRFVFFFCFVFFRVRKGPFSIILSVNRMILRLLFVLCAVLAPRQPFRESRYHLLAKSISGSAVDHPPFRLTHNTSIFGPNVRLRLTPFSACLQYECSRVHR